MYEDMFDRVGRKALSAELALLAEHWPETDVVVLRPDERVLDVSRPNPMSAGATIPTLLATLRSMQHELARSSVWNVLTRHLAATPEAG